MALPDFSISKARYAKSMMAVRCPSLDGYKTRAARLASKLSNWRYSGREGAYIMSATKAAKFERLFAEGWDALAFNGELIAPRAEAA